MSDIRINSSPRPIPEQTETTGGDHPKAPANPSGENARDPTAEYDKVMKSGLLKHLLEQQSQALKPGGLHPPNPVETGMQSASEWLLRQGKLMQSEAELRGGDSGKQNHSSGPIHNSSLEKK